MVSNLNRQTKNALTRSYNNTYCNFTLLADEKKSNKNYDRVKLALKEGRKNFKTSFSNPIVLKYSLWFILGMAGYFQVSFK